MKRNALPNGEKYIRKHRLQKRWHKVMMVLGSVVVFCTTYALILPAITMERGCPLPEHTHSDSCYTQVLPETKRIPACSAETLELHRHTAACYGADNVLTCGYANYMVHVHDAACYDDDGNFWCPLPTIKEHRHDESCYASAAHVHDESCYVQERDELTCPLHEHSDACWAEEEVLVCGQEEAPGHRHDDSCLTVTESLACGQPESDGHQHSDACRDEGGNLVCGLEESAGHHHSPECYTQHTEITCGQEETSGHQHSEACYQLSRELVCGIESDHQHTDECYSMTDVLICGEEEAPEDASADPEPICGKEEIILHRHTENCFDVYGNLICDKIQVLAHQHGENCFAVVEPTDANALTCTIPEGEGAHTHSEACYDERGALVCTLEENSGHQHTERCYGTWELTCGMEEHVHTDMCYSSVEGEKDADDAAAADTPDDVASPEENLDIKAGMLNVSLLYGDQQPQSQYPDGVSYYTHTNMSGYLKLEPSGLESDLTDVTVTLSIPKQYVEKSSVNIPQFSTNSSSTQYEILPVEEDEENYYARIHFTTYDKTQTLVLPFLLGFMDDVVPDNYKLPVIASVSGGNTTEPNIYKPLYKLWEITKYVNSNRQSEFAKDGAEVVVTPLEEGGNPYLDDLTYVDFAFIVNGCTYEGADLRDWRDASEVTLTDSLPQYTDKDGNVRIAVFDAEKNPGWTLSADGATVSKTYQGTRSGDVLTQIYNDVLHLRFPGLKFETAEDGNLIADLDNSVHLTAVPSNATEGETYPEADDSLQFRMTSDPSTGGRFSKWATKGDIYDVDSYKTNPYPWRVSLSNDQKKTTPLRHIVIQDREITENGETVLKGLDEALKFVRLESDGHSVLGSGQTYADIIDKIVAYYTDGTTRDYTITESDLNASGHFAIDFDETKVCNGYEIIFRDDYAMQHGESVEFQVYTVYRDPDHTHVPEGQSKVTYINEARSINSYQNMDETVYVFLKQAGSYDMLPSTEELRVDKVTLVNDGSSTWDGIGGNTVGSTYCYVVRLRGTLLEPEVKEYKDIRIVDLLPDGVYFEKIHLIQQSPSLAPVLDGGKNYQPEIVENYHNSGRTAVIFHLNTENLRNVLKSKDGPDIYFGVTIAQDAHPGTVRNYVYVVGDNLDEYQGKDQQKSGGTEDIYDLNSNGRTDDRIAYGFDDATIVAAQSIYAEKFIAPAGSDNWSKQGLRIKAGAAFDYLLEVTNETGSDYHDLTIYDTLPRTGDKNIFAQASRGSEFPVCLRGPITAPDGYKVLYTMSSDVYQRSMHDMLNEAVWSESVSDYAAVTAFQITAVGETTLAKNSVFQVQIPVKAAETLDEAAMAILHGKTEQDQSSGTVTYLEAINSFGFRTREAAEEKESNVVWVRVPFAGFCAKKIDGTSSNALSGAEFTLTDAAGKVIATVTSGEDGFMQFRELTEGTYTLTETRVPDGYMDKQLSVTVVITQNPITMEYNISFGNLYAGAGSTADPLCIPNYTTPILPATGGTGTLPYTAGGTLLILAALYLLYSYKKRRKEAQASN